MGQSLAAAADGGMSNPLTLSPEQRRLLTEGDIEGLLELHNSMFGPLMMKDDDADDADSDDDEDDDQDDDSDDADDSEDDDVDGEDGDEDKGKAKKPPEDPKDRRIQELSAEGKKKRLRIREQRNMIAKLESENAALKRGKPAKKDDDSDKDESSGKVEPSADTRKLEELSRTNEDLLIRVEFMGNKKHSWKNPKAALRLLDLSDVEIVDGEIEGLEEAIDELAKEEPYLLDTSRDERDEKSRRRRGATGHATGGKPKGNPDREKLINKYPALRR